MGIDFMKTGTSVGVGALDEVLEWWDERQGRTETFRKATDIGRLALAGLGYAMQIFWPRQARIGEAMALSATPLLIKSVAKPIRQAIAPAASQQNFVPRTRAPIAPAAPASMPFRVPAVVESEEPVIVATS